jgi:hypothetical protein
MSFRCCGPDACPTATTTSVPMDYPALFFMVAVITAWGTMALLLAVLVAGETVDWWYRKRSRGALSCVAE